MPPAQPAPSAQPAPPAAAGPCPPGQVALTGSKKVAVYLDTRGSGSDQVEGTATIVQDRCIQPAMATIENSCPPDRACSIKRGAVTYCYAAPC
jgi:hypothetical protein